MKPPKQLFTVALVLVALLTGALAQTATAPTPVKPKKKAPTAASKPAVTAADIQALKDGLAAAQQQIQALQDELHRRDQAVQQAQTTATAAAAKADAAQVQAKHDQQSVDALQTDLADLKSVNFSSSNPPELRNALLNMQEPMVAQQTPGTTPGTEVYNKQMESPITIRFRGINITPGGYAAGEFVRRSRALGADINTPFNSLTMPGASQSQIPEFFGSGRQSKVTTFVDGRLGNVDLSSYVSADFLSSGTTSTATQTNSYTMRMRQAWAQAKFQNGISFLAGQSWSLVTENGVGIAIDDDMGKTNDARPKTIDPNYSVGFDFARQYGLRVTKSFGTKFAAAVAVENDQATVTTHGNANNFLIGEAGASSSYNSTSTYSFNPSPDIIAKVAFDPGFGHYEVYGLLDRFQDRVFPCVEYATGNPICTATGATSATGAYNTSKEGGGVGASARITIAHHFVFGLKGFGGSGVGRYAPGGLPDAAVNPDGTLHLVKNLHGLGTLEWKGKKLTLFSYGGVEYAARTYGFDSIAGKNVGYGAPTFNNSGCYTEVAPGSGGFSPGGTGTCTGDTRALIEGTLGFWYKFYSGPKGAFQYGTQFSYVTRNTWSGNGGLTAGAPGLQPNGLDGMVFTSFRYYLP
ncbi:MAG: hypothetical protein WCC32_07385 [Terriglobales bacterium]